MVSIKETYPCLCRWYHHTIKKNSSGGVGQCHTWTNKEVF